MTEPTDLAVMNSAQPEEDNLPLVALTPWEMPEQQRRLAEWCVRKIDSVQRELATFVALEDEAIAGGFKAASYHANVLRTKKRIVYYEKIKAAVEAGYLIVPNMPTRTFAVRVKRRAPRHTEASYPSSSNFLAKPDILPRGEGRYVDESMLTERETIPEQSNGKVIEKIRYFSTEFDEDVDFPLQGVLPEVLAATSRAMALKLFDQLGVVLNTGGRDPIVVGQLLDPRGHDRCVTFFVAWWLKHGDVIGMPSSIQAVLVDGVGRTRTMMLHQPLPCVLVPAPVKFNLAALALDAAAWPSTNRDIEFQYIGTLPDGRRVYGYRFPDGEPYQLWEHRTSWTAETERSVQGPIAAAVDARIDQELGQLGCQIVRLYDVTSSPDAWLRERHLMGVARRR